MRHGPDAYGRLLAGTVPCRTGRACDGETNSRGMEESHGPLHGGSAGFWREVLVRCWGVVSQWCMARMNRYSFSFAVNGRDFAHKAADIITGNDVGAVDVMLIPHTDD